MKTTILVAAVLLGAYGACAVADDDKARYNQRAAQTDLALFSELDRGGNGFLTKADVRGDMHLGTRFNDIDTNRDDIVTPQEMRSYIERTYGVSAPAPAPAPR